MIAQLHNAVDGEKNEISDRFARLLEEQSGVNDIRLKRKQTNA